VRRALRAARTLLVLEAIGMTTSLGLVASGLAQHRGVVPAVALGLGALEGLALHVRHSRARRRAA
jgi:hypothetical protein